MKKHYIPLMLSFFLALTTFAQTPGAAAPTPIEDAADVVSIYSETYSNVSVANFDPYWGQAVDPQVNTTFDPTGSATNFALEYLDFTYQGTQLDDDPANALDLSDMEFFHVDIWVPAGTDRQVRVSPINFGTGAGEFQVEVPLTPGSWNSVTLDKADFTGMTWDALNQLIFNGQFNGDGSANTTPFNIYLDNIYFSQTPATGPSNDDCDNAIALTVNSDLGCTNVTSGTNVDSTPSPQTDDVTGAPDNDVWFSFVANNDAHQISLSNKVAVVGTSVDMGMGLYDGTGGCAALSLVDDSDPDTLNATGLMVGTTYYLRVYGWYSSTSSSYSETTFDVCVGTPPPPPANDDCSGALPLTVTTDNTTFTSFSTDFATEGADEIVDCDAFTNLGVWYTFTAPATDLEFLQGANGNPGITIYEGPDCNNLTELDINCINNNSGSISGLTVGNNYYAMIWTDTTESTVDFVLYFIDCQPPSALTASNVTTTSADLSWTAGDVETEWELLWGPTGFDPATEGTLINDNDGTLGVNLSGLTEATTYDFYVAAVCSPGSTSPQLGPLAFTTACATFVAPYNEDFNANPTSIPNCWSQGAANAEDWLFRDTPTGHIGNNGSFPNSSASGGGFAWVDDSGAHNIGTRLESPLIDVSGLTTPALSFYYISDNEGDSNGNVDFSVEVWDGAAWNQVFFSNQNSPNEEWTEVIIDVSTLTLTGDIQLAFIVDENNGTGFDDDVAIDDISVNEAPACLKPTNLVASNLTLDSADISWDTVASASSGYIWSLFVAGDDPLVDAPLDSGLTDSSTTSVNLIGLIESTDYEFYVESDCGVDGTSGLSAPLAFSTLTPGLDCESAIAATVAPFGDTSQPIVYDTTTVPDMSSVPSCEGFDSTEQGFWYDFTTNATDGVLLSLLSGDAGDIEGAIYDSCGGTELFCFADGNSQDFTSDVLVTGLTAGTTYILQVYTESFNDGAFSLAITDLPACPQPVNLNATGVGFDSATLNWDSVTNATNGYSYEVYTSPSDVTTDTPVDSGTVAEGTNSVTVTGLLAETDYDFYIIADCNTDGTSTQAGPATFITGCAPFVPNYLEEFTNMTGVIAPDCWVEAQNGDPTTGPTGFGSGEWYSDNFLNSGSTSATINLWNLGTSDWLISPTFDLSAGGYEVAFEIGQTDYNDTFFTQMGSDDQVQFLYSDDAGATWNVLITWAKGSEPSVSGELAVTDLSSITGSAVQFAFWGTEGTVDDLEDVEIFIDNFEVRTLPPPANDNLCDAIPLTVGAPSAGDAYTNVLATAEANEPVAICFNGGINGSVWFTFDAPASGDVTVTTDIAGASLTDTEVAVFDAPTDCTDLSTLGAELGCDQDGGSIINFNSIVNLSGLTPGATYYVQVDQWGTATPGTFGIRVIDNNPPCPNPTNLNVTNIGEDSATLNWDDVVEATAGFEWSVYLSPSDPTVDTPVASGTTGAGVITANVSGLSPQTDYDFYVLSDCDLDGVSILADPVTFTTACEAIVPDYLEEFTNMTADLAPNCWTEAQNGDPTTGPTEFGSGEWYSDNFLNSGSTSATINLWNLGTSDWLISPSFDLSAGGYEVVFDIGQTDYNDTFFTQMGSDDQVQFLYSDDNGATWNVLITWAQGSEPSVSGELSVTDLSAITGSAVQFAFWGTEGAFDDAEDIEIFIDNFEVRTPPACPEPTGLTVSNITIDSADLSWNDNATATNGYVWSVFTSPSDPLVDTPVSTGNTGAGVTTATATGLMSATSYDFYLTANCDTNGTSILVGPVTFSTTPDFCGGDLFYDNGGPGANYSNNANETTTISPANPGDVVTVEFLSFNTEFNWDGIQIYDGPDSSSPLIDSGYVAPGFSPLPDGTWTGTGANSAEGVTFVSSHPSGALTFVFTSDTSATRSGWEAVVTCVAPEVLDYYNLQFPATGDITTGDSFSAFAQAYEAGLTDASDTPAAGIEAWIGYSTTDSSPDTPADWIWVPATTNPSYDFTLNNDEYFLDLGAEIGAEGTYYYASRWSLNGGPFTYGGILPDGSNGGEWGTGGFVSGVLTVTDPLATPMTPAPDPTEDPALVISMYSGVYSNVPVDTWLTPWSPPATVLEDIQIQGNDTKKYSNLDFAGIETVANPIDASGMDFFHMDVWSPNATTFRVKLVDLGAGVEGEIAFSIAQEQWVSLQIPLTDFADPAVVTNPANLLTSTTSIQQLIISGLPAGAVTAYVDNVFFSSTTVGTAQFDSNNFSFYPNPANHELNLITKNQVEQVKVYNMLGQQVMVETLNTVSPRLNVQGLQAGTYIMNVTIDGASKNFKFVKE